jgi:hypothetical protein
MPGIKSWKTVFTANCTHFDFNFCDGFHCGVGRVRGKIKTGQALRGLARFDFATL